MSDMPGDLVASLEHHALLSRKVATLMRAAAETEEQILQRAGALHRSGELQHEHLVEIFDRLRDTPMSGMHQRWTRLIGIPISAIRHVVQNRPNLTESSWWGHANLPSGEPVPHKGQCVVYVLYDSMWEPCYVGSTQQLRTRLGAHLRDGKTFAYWTAQKAPDRAAAFAMEATALAEQMPRLNKRRSA